MWGIVFSQHVYAFRSYFRQSWFRGFIFSGYQDFPIPVQDFIGSDYGASHSIDLAKFENTKLGSAIHYYAPHLFEYDAEKDKRD